MKYYDSLPPGFTAVSTGTVIKGDIVRHSFESRFEDAAGIIDAKITKGQTSGGYTVYRLPDEALLPEFTIKNRFDDSVIFTGKGVSLEAVLLSAYKSGANLSGANLSGANLSGAKIGAHKFTGKTAHASRSDGYEFRIFTCAKGAVIRAGCRTFTPAEFKKHTKTYKSKMKRKETLALISHLEKALKYNWSK